MNTPSNRQQLRQEIDLPGPVALWVLLTHAFVLLSPLTLIWAVDAYGGQLVTPLAHPTLIQLASAIYIGAIAFELAQNSADRWYLTEATRSVADMAFNSFMMLAFCLYTIGFYANVWMSVAAVVLTLLYPFAYASSHPAQRVIGSIVPLLATTSLYLATRDPAALLFLVINGIAVYMIVMLIKTRSQWLHGWGAFGFGLAFLTWPWAVANAAAGQPLSWLFAGAATTALILLALAVTPVIRGLPATPRTQFSD